MFTKPENIVYTNFKKILNSLRNNLYIAYPLLVFCLVSFDKYLHSCNCYDNEDAKNSYHSNKFPHVLLYLIFSVTLSPWKSLLWFLSLQLYFFKNHRGCSLLHLVSFICFWDSSMLWHVSIVNIFLIYCWVYSIVWMYWFTYTFHQWWTFQLFLVFSKYEWSCYKHLHTDFFFSSWLKKLGVGLLECYWNPSGVGLLMDLIRNQ